MNEPVPSPSNPSDTAELEAILARSERSSRRRRVILFVLLGVGVVALAWFVWHRLGSGESASGAQAFELAKVTRGDLRSTISATSTVQALNTVEVGAEVSGRIAALHADFNDTVEQGTLIAEIDPEQSRAAVAQANAQVLAARAGVAEAQAQVLEARQEAQRVRALADKGLASSRELEAATAKASRSEAAVLSAQASAAVAKASYDSARSRLDKTEIRAPIRGTVLSRKVEVGQTINAGMQTPVLFVIAEDLRRMQLSARVDEADIGAVQVGQTASFTVDAHPGKTFASTLTAVRNVPQTDQNVVSYEVLLSVDNEALLLRPGMTATVEIVTAVQKAALLVPNKALRFKPPSEERRGPPIGIPFLGRGGKKSSDKPQEERQESLGKLAAHQALLWLPGTPAPRPLKVDKIATDGVQTAVSAPSLKEGAEVIVDLLATGGPPQ